MHLSWETEDIQLMIDNQMVIKWYLTYAIEGYKHKEIATMLESMKEPLNRSCHIARKILQQQINTTKKFDYGTK
jgi:RNA polymerase sigma-70 factor (ECF subfamily)